ncbi:MAG: uridine phosphorylase [Clostridia bacterium]|nr:uridine phosphorylase [Clostridia bacterium]
MLHTDETQYHIAARKGEIGKYCLLPGDPGRCEQIAACLENPYHLSTNREYNIWCGALEGERITVCSTGIGGPSTAIAVEELAACGAHTFIRIGTCGGIALPVKAGDVVIASGAVRQDGTSHEYAPPEFPAVPDTGVLLALTQAARELGYSYHTGVVQSKDSFYGQHSPHRMPISGELIAKWEAWKRLGVLASEMEAATLFTVCASLGLASGAVFLSVWNQERFSAGLDTDSTEVHDTEKAIRTAVHALRHLIREGK